LCTYRFFDLPLDAKMEVVANKYNRGYTTMQDETLDTAGQKCGDTKEVPRTRNPLMAALTVCCDVQGYYIARECGTPVNDLEGPNQWPDESLLPQWRETMMR
jgi:isopenicillin N synthase-like dioxygenase